MAKDKYSATWVSHTSMSDFLECPRSYFLKNVYKDPATNHKIQIMSPALALGQVVHQVIEALSVLPTDKRFAVSLVDAFDSAWKKVSGKRGGFTSADQEARYQEEGREMLRQLMKDPGPLKNKAVKIQTELPYYWLSEEDSIILCGKVDWLEYLPESDSVHIIDFKTSKREINGSSLQLPIYHLLVHNTQSRTVSKVSYWYLRQENGLVEQPLPDLDEAEDIVLQLAKKIQLQRKLNIFKCPTDGCRACLPFEAVLRGEAELVGENDFRQDVYILTKSQNDQADSVVL